MRWDGIGLSVNGEVGVEQNRLTLYAEVKSNVFFRPAMTTLSDWPCIQALVSCVASGLSYTSKLFDI